MKLSESTQLLLEQTADRLIKTGKDPIFLIESFVILNKSKFTEDVVSNMWRDVKNYFQGGSGAVAAGRHDIESEYLAARKALETIITHINKFKGTDTSTETDILNLINNTIANLDQAKPLVAELGKKIRQSAAADRVPAFGGRSQYQNQIDPKEFGSIPDFKKGSKITDVMNWFASLAANPSKDNLKQSIFMNARNSQVDMTLVSNAAREYQKLKQSNSPTLTNLYNIGIKDAETYAKIYAYLVQQKNKNTPPVDFNTLIKNFQASKNITTKNANDILMALNNNQNIDTFVSNAIKKAKQIPQPATTLGKNVNLISRMIDQNIQKYPKIIAAIGKLANGSITPDSKAFLNILAGLK